MRVAANEKAEAEKILQIKRAEGEAESKYLSGLGIACQRQAIMDGLRHSVLEFSLNVPGTLAKDVMDMVLFTQYFDTMNFILLTQYFDTRKYKFYSRLTTKVLEKHHYLQKEQYFEILFTT